MSSTATAPQQILQRIAAGDGSAVQACIDTYGPLLWSLVRRAGLQGSEGEDIVQEIFIELWRTAERFDPSLASEKVFIAMIARRRLIDVRRKLGRRPETAEIAETTASSARAHDEVLAEHDEGQRAQRALGQLRPEQQSVLKLSLYEGLSHQEISDSTGMPLGTVKTHARRGLQRVRELLGVDSGPAARGVTA